MINSISRVANKNFSYWIQSLNLNYIFKLFWNHVRPSQLKCIELEIKMYNWRNVNSSKANDELVKNYVQIVANVFFLFFRIIKIAWTILWAGLKGLYPYTPVSYHSRLGARVNRTTNRPRSIQRKILRSPIRCPLSIDPLCKLVRGRYYRVTFSEVCAIMMTTGRVALNCAQHAVVQILRITAR